MSQDYKGVRLFVKYVVNPVLFNATRLPFGPFALIRHVGRKSGKAYENPIMVWRVADGFIIELTYGRQVDWLRNLQAAPEGTLRWHRREYTFHTPVFVDEETGLRALPPPASFIFRTIGGHEFVKLADLTPAPTSAPASHIKPEQTT
jgi:deazaflavin-dependent oxidoreductase (nitroreductase family)